MGQQLKLLETSQNIESVQITIITKHA